MSKEDKINKLESEILKHKKLYYAGMPKISDIEYDNLEEELKKINPNSKALQLVGSYFFSSEKIAHTRKMLSLNKTYKLEELIKWKGTEDILSTFKIDGSSCSLVYENGNLIQAKTRGDGKYGENILSKVHFMDSIPKNIKSKGVVEIRGEVFCVEKNFFCLSQKMEELGLEKPTSQRNIVAGLLGRKENINLCHWLDFQAFELLDEKIILNTEKEKFEKLVTLGFFTPEYNINKTEKDLLARLEEAREFIAEGDYLVDGLVFSYNNLKLHTELGETAHHPRYKIAFKFQGDIKTTKIKSISWQVSRNGILTPVANVETVELSGAKVSRVTLHNYGLVKQFELKKDDKIKIVRSGEVIPKFLEVEESSKGEFKVPKTCPSCGENITIKDIRLLCTNAHCPDIIKDEILNYIKKIGIEDLSYKRLEELIKCGLIVDIPSLYNLRMEQLLEVDKVKEKLASKIIQSIKDSLQVDLITFLSALGISGGAYNKCEKVVFAGFDTIEKILGLKIEDLMNVESFAEKSSEEFISSINDKKKMIVKLISYGFKFDAKIETPVESSISGLKYCITGTLSMKRSELQKIVKKNGGIVQSGVSKDTNFLITNDTESTSSKFKKAQELGVEIITEDVFLSSLK